MIDQSYSADNFYRILDYENRRGNYKEGEFFPAVYSKGLEIKQTTISYRKRKKELNSRDDIARLKSSFKDELKLLKEQKSNILFEELHRISGNVIKDNWDLELKEHKDAKSGKTFYLTRNNPETFFALKQSQYCIKKLYKVKQSHRNNIVHQVKILLSDGSPKAIVRADIKEFYESIPVNRLLRKINKDNLLSQLTKKIINRTIRKYLALSGSEYGVPRGIGISAYLSELYLREFDDEIRSLPNVFYYARYVDDIIIFVTTDDDTDEAILKQQIADILKVTCDLNLNQNKTFAHVINDPKVDLNTPKEIEYLGYKFLIGKNDLSISLSTKKIDKYKEKIDKLIANYSKSEGSKNDRRILVNGIKFITSNTRLLNNKSNVLIGIYYSNVLLTDYDILDKLDKYIIEKLDSVGLSNLKSYIQHKRYLFRDGFLSKKFVAFRPTQMTKILSIWK